MSDLVRDDRDDMEAEDALKHVIIKDPSGQVVHVGEYVSEDSLDEPTEEETATGELFPGFSDLSPE